MPESELLSPYRVLPAGGAYRGMERFCGAEEFVY